MKTITKIIFAAFAATALTPMASLAAGSQSKNQGYLVDSPESAIVRSGTGLCWHTGEWASGSIADACDPTSKKPAVAEVPAAAPVVMAALAPVSKPSSQKIRFSDDALFAFDKSVLKPEGQAMLDGLVRQIDGATYDNIVVTGHTDRFGSEQYNQKLSERRAQAVKDYLVSKNIQIGRIDAEGKGETQPMTKAGDCQGPKSLKSVACLQQDRRVDVEMTGSKTVASTQ